MLQPADTLILFGVICERDERWTFRSLAERLGVALPKVQRALARLGEAGLYDPERRRAVVPAAEEFVVHALKYLQPLHEGPLVRGVPTAWAAAPLRDELAGDDELAPVWPSPHGAVRGAAVEPLDPVVPALVERWPDVAELAALADAIRLGDRRTRSAATRHLRNRLAASR